MRSRMPSLDIFAYSSGTERAEVSGGFKVTGQAVAKQVQVLGPDDVVGINRRAERATSQHGFVYKGTPNGNPALTFHMRLTWQIRA